jgi:cell wall-associated NlpC family hydrolase
VSASRALRHAPRRTLAALAVLATCTALAPPAAADARAAAPRAAGADLAGAAGPDLAGPAEADLAGAAQHRWETSAEVTAEATTPRPAGDPVAQPLAGGMRDRVVEAAYWYRDRGTPYVWSSGWLPCNKDAADCECLNRLAYWDGGWGQLTYTLQGQANTGHRTRDPRPGDLVFWDYNGDGYFGAHDHTGVYVGNGYAIHASTYWGRVVRTTVRAVSVEARGTYYVSIIG